MIDRRRFAWLSAAGWLALLVGVSSPARGDESPARATAVTDAAVTDAAADDEAAAGADTAPGTAGGLETRIGQLIEQLGDGSYHVRVNAAWELSRIGLPAFGQLRQATDHANIQIATAARYLVQSQNVTWWLDTDSTEVRRILADYNRLNEVERDTRLQRLAEIGTQDALLALCRLARFESDDRLSKSAALYLMEYIAERGASATLARSIAVTAGEDGRPATNWLLKLCQDLDADSADAAAWQAFATAEIETAASLREIMQGRRPLDEANAGALRFYRWIGSWLTDRNGREPAMQIAQQSLDLVADNTYAHQEFAKWAVAAELPELVIRLASENTESFNKEPVLGFILAECYLLAGDSETAESVAKAASDRVEALTASIRQQIPNTNINDLNASRRLNCAAQLITRGLFSWAEREYERALAVPTSGPVEAMLRSKFAELYWMGGEYANAAEVLRSLHEQAGGVDKGLPGPNSIFVSVSSSYFFYAGLVAVEASEHATAMDLLVQSIEAEMLSSQQANPDVVIAMSEIADTPERQQLFEQQFDAMLQDFRRRVVTAEQVLAESPDRRSREYVGKMELAPACNQLAWLLCKCKMHGEEALNLSRRSLEFRPDEPAYLDTLARCQFSAGMVAEAIVSQKQALALTPHDRQMKLQLAEFEAAAVGE